MELKYLVYKKEELEHGGHPDEDARRLFARVQRHGITVAEISEGSLREYFWAKQILPELSLVIASTEETLKEAEALLAAALGYQNPDFPDEPLGRVEYVAEGLEEVDVSFLERVYQRKHGIPWRILETKRCYLREMTLSDLPDLYRLYEGEGMTKYMEPLYEREEEEAYAKAYIRTMYRFYGYGMWLVKDRLTNELIGRAGFDHYIENDETLLEMGYAIAASRQRRGYATEVCEAMIAYAKEAAIGYDKLYCFVREGNAASRALLLRLGFSFQTRTVRDGKDMLRYVRPLL